MRTGGRITSAKRYKIFVSSDKGCSKWELYLASLQLSHFLTRPEIMAATANVATEHRAAIDNLICMSAAVRLRWGSGEADTVTGEKFAVLHSRWRCWRSLIRQMSSSKVDRVDSVDSVDSGDSGELQSEQIYGAQHRARCHQHSTANIGSAHKQWRSSLWVLVGKLRILEFLIPQFHFFSH